MMATHVHRTERSLFSFGGGLLFRLLIENYRMLLRNAINEAEENRQQHEDTAGEHFRAPGTEAGAQEQLYKKSLGARIAQELRRNHMPPPSLPLSRAS